ncbi:MAG: CcmD family protein [Bacteroidia bacterium]|nr:CcmD family protein [Bacteroidia bacterium]
MAFILLIFFSATLSAQNSEPVEMADLFYREGKIYLVIAIVSIVFGGMALYLFLMDRKITRIEKKINDKYV